MLLRVCMYERMKYVHVYGVCLYVCVVCACVFYPYTFMCTCLLVGGGVGGKGEEVDDCTSCV